MRDFAKIVKRPVAFLVVSLVFSIPLLRAGDFFFDSAGVKIHYTMEGKGEPVLLIHGFSQSIQMWTSTGIIKELSDNFQVIALDNRGHGQSGKPHDTNSYGKNLIDDSIRLLDHLKIKIMVIPKASHVTAFSDPEFIKNLKAFLMEHSAAGLAKGSGK